MMDYLRELRLLPIAVVASACLLALTAADLLLDRPESPVADAPVEASIVHVAPAGSRPSDSKQSDSKQSDSKQSWAQQMFNFPGSSGSNPAPAPSAAPPPLPQIAADKGNADLIVTGSIGGSSEDKSKAKGEGAAANGKDGKPASAAKEGQPPSMNKDGAARPPDGVTAMPGAPALPSGAERVLLERLSERRQELEKRGRELDIREGLIAEAEKRVDARLAEIKDAKAQLAVAVQQKDDAEAARFKGLVTMYETMKPRDAAKIFDRLETDVLIEVASQINPRNMSEILALMSPDAAQRLTVELANRAKAVVKDPNADLPKIEGRPAAQ